MNKKAQNKNENVNKNENTWEYSIVIKHDFFAILHLTALIWSSYKNKAPNIKNLGEECQKKIIFFLNQKKAKTKTKNEQKIKSIHHQWQKNNILCIATLTKKTKGAMFEFNNNIKLNTKTCKKHRQSAFVI